YRTRAHWSLCSWKLWDTASMKLCVSCRLFEPRRMTPKPRHDSARALPGSRSAMSSASALEAASIVMRTDMSLPCSYGRTAGLARRVTACRSKPGAVPGPTVGSAALAQPPAPHAHVREEEDDEDDCENEVENH